MKKRSSRRGKRVYRRQGMAINLVILTAAIIAFACFAVCTVNARERRSVQKYYTSIEIAQGQTLWSIAGEYMSEEYDNRRAYIWEVMRLNHLKSDDEIHAGEYLTIPYYSSEIPSE